MSRLAPNHYVCPECGTPYVPVTRAEHARRYRTKHREKDNERKRRWYHKHKNDPEARRKERERSKAYRDRCRELRERKSKALEELRLALEARGKIRAAGCKGNDL